MDLLLFESLPADIKRIVEEYQSSNPDISERELAQWLCQLQEIPYLDVKLNLVDVNLIKHYGVQVCRDEKFLPLYRNGVIQVVAIARPWVRRNVNKIIEKEYDEVRLVGIYEEDLEAILDQLEASGTANQVKKIVVKELPSIIYGWGNGDDIELAIGIIRNAYRVGASDIHVEPMEDRVAVKFRVHGSLVVQTPIEGTYRWHVLDSFKKLAGVAVSDRRTLKDASFSVQVTPTKTIDIRFVALPIGGAEGENLVMRLLDKDNIKAMMGKLPFEGERLDLFGQCLDRDSGLILITGPTGSGKSTTLYTALLSLDLANLNVRTVEDPVEYRIDKIMQTQVDKKNDVTTVNALRAILRADPDVILVGEIRDQETASLAISASNTGHLVLSTLHTNDAVSVLTRLLDLNLTRQEIYENLTLAVAQRLVPTICPHCKMLGVIDDRIQKHYAYHEMIVPDKVFVGAGCPECKGTGVAGRKPIFQFFYMNDEMKVLVGSGSDLSVIRKANTKYFKPLMGDALRCVSSGIADYHKVKSVDPDFVYKL